MASSKNAHEDSMRELETIVEESFEVEMLASGFVRRGRGWKRWRDAVTAAVKANAQSEYSEAAIKSRAEAIQQRFLYYQNVEALFRAHLDAARDIWINNLNYTQSMVRDLVCRCPPYIKELRLKKVHSIRKECGATSMLEKLLVEWKVLACIQHQQLADNAEMFKDEFPSSKKLFQQVKSAELRAKRAAHMCSVARQLLRAEKEGSEQEHCDCSTEATATLVMDATPSVSNTEDLILS